MLSIKNHKDGKNVIVYCYDENNKFILIMGKKYFDYLKALVSFEKTVNLEPRIIPEVEGYIFQSELTKEEFDFCLEFQEREDIESDDFFKAFEMIQEVSTMIDNDNFLIELFINGDKLMFECSENENYSYININSDEFIELLNNKNIIDAYLELKNTLNKYDLYCDDDEVDLDLKNLEQAIGI